MATAATPATDLLERARMGDVVATTQLISGLEALAPSAVAVRGELHAAGGGARVIGVTGAPGSGKSTLVGALTHELRGRGVSVGIVAVDPSSSRSGGAILGDRIRMQEHTLDAGTFMRSMSSRGSLGGVSRATVDAVAVLDAAGWDVVIVETVGVGQADVDVVRIAHTTLVVSVPGLGDDIQAIKAGLIELADVHVVNKADRPGANKTMAELLAMLTLGGPTAPGAWAVPVVGTSAASGDGVAELADRLADHWSWMRASGDLQRRERLAAVARIKAIANDMLVERLADPTTDDGFDALVEAVAARRLDPHAAAAQLIDGAAVTT